MAKRSNGILDRHPFDFKMGQNASWLSWRLTANEKAILKALFQQWASDHLNEDRTSLLIFETLREILERPTHANRFRMNRPQALAFDQMFRFYQWLGTSQEFLWLPRAMMNDIEAHIYKNTNEIDLRR